MKILGQAVAKYLTEGELDVSNTDCDLLSKNSCLKEIFILSSLNY